MTELLREWSPPPSSNRCEDSSSSFSDLAPEIVLMIFQSLSSFADVVALMRATHRFHDIWTLNVPRICSAVLPRAIDCIADAEGFIAVKSQNPKLPKLGRVKYTRSGHDKIFRPIKRFLALQRIVNIACDIYESEVLETPGARIHHPTLTLTRPERQRFIHCYYRVWTYVEMANAHHFKQLLSLRWDFMENISMRDAHDLFEMCYWLRKKCRYELLKPLGITNAWNMAGKWDDALEEISLHCEFKKDKIPQYAERDFPRPETYPHVYTVLDHFQDHMDNIADMPSHPTS